MTDWRLGCECRCCDHGEGSDYACECHAIGQCSAKPAAREGDGQLQKVRAYLRRLATSVTKAHEFQVVRREREDGEIEYQIFADTTRPKNGMQVAYVQSTRHDAEFVAACLAQAPLFDKLLAEGEAAQTALRQEVERLRKENELLRWQQNVLDPSRWTE